MSHLVKIDSYCDEHPRHSGDFLPGDLPRRPAEPVSNVYQLGGSLATLAVVSRPEALSLHANQVQDVLHPALARLLPAVELLDHVMGIPTGGSDQAT